MGLINFEEEKQSSIPKNHDIITYLISIYNSSKIKKPFDSVSPFT